MEQNKIIYESNEKDMIISFNEEKRWQVSRGNKIFELNIDENLVFCLPLLEEEFSLFFKSLDPLDINDPKFPMAKLILFGFKTRSLYWIKLSFVWLKEYSYVSNVFESFKEDLLELSLDNKIPQNIRHYIMKRVK